MKTTEEGRKQHRAECKDVIARGEVISCLVAGQIIALIDDIDELLALVKHYADEAEK